MIILSLLRLPISATQLSLPVSTLLENGGQGTALLLATAVAISIILRAITNLIKVSKE